MKIAQPPVRRHARSLRVLSLAAVLVWFAVAPRAPALAFSPPDPATLVKPELVAEDAAIAPGTTLWVDLHLKIAPGWHTYWRNPGDAGVATAITWHLPPGFAAGPAQWPVPERFVEGGIGTYGYRDVADLLVPIAVPKGLVSGTMANLQGEAIWLVCSQICVPGSATLSLALPVAQQPVADPGAAALFAAARQALPAPALFEAHFAATDKELRLFVPAAAAAGLSDPQPQFFPAAGRLIDHAAPATVAWRDGGIQLGFPRAALPAPLPATLDGVLVLTGKAGGARAYALSANPGAAPPPVDDDMPWGKALLLAFLGGVILNAMPCVFPILSLKLLSLARHAHGHRREQAVGGFAYAGGVLASFLALGGALLALRAGGEAVGWGFQLQSPVFVVLLAYFLFAMGLGLSGVVGFGDGVAALGGRLAARHGTAGAVLTGVLATLLATPCTAPLMGAATGFALVAPAPLALGVFAALGLGLAAPYLLASLLPGWQRWLPRPGAWMELARQVLAFPLYATVAWLAWVALQEVAPGQGLALLGGFVLVGFAAWAWGRARFAAPGRRRFGAAAASLGAAAAIVLAASLTAAGPGLPAPGALGWEPFTPARLAALSDKRQPVFVDMTAAWCVTCLINEHAVLDAGPVRQAFAAHGVVALKGDWTRQNPDITRFLQQFGRSGVPLYLLYDRAGSARVLPQILTEATVLAAVDKI